MSESALNNCYQCLFKVCEVMFTDSRIKFNAEMKESTCDNNNNQYEGM